MKRILLIVLAGIVVITGLAVAWYLASPLFINRTVDEAFPIEVPPVEELEQMPEEELVELEERFLGSLPPEEKIAEMPQDEREMLESKAMQISTVMPDKIMAEPMPTSIPEQTATVPAVPVLVAEGYFYGVDDLHPVGLVQDMAGKAAAGHQFLVDLHRDALATQLQQRHQGGHIGALRHLPGFAIDVDLHVLAL